MIFVNFPYDVCEFIREMKFDRLGVFTYSCEEGTAAARMDGQIDEEVMKDRQDAEKIGLDIQ